MKHLIFAVDDEESIRDLYKYSIGGADFECECFESGEALFKAIKRQTPELILLDIMLDGDDGYTILQKLKADINFSKIPVIMVSAKGEEISKVKGLDLGADDYLSKPFGVLELIARIKANLRKNSHNEEKKILTYKDIVIDEFKHLVKINNNELSLTFKEFNLLKELVLNTENAVSREELLNRVWGYDYIGETRTLDIHIGQLRKYLIDNKSQTEIVTVRKVGYLLK